MKSKLKFLIKKGFILVITLAIITLSFNSSLVFASPLDSGEEVNYSLDKTEITLLMNERTTLAVNSEMQNYEVSWSSSDTNVVTVDNGGNIIAIDKGTATIEATITTESISQELTCIVNVVYKEFDTVSDMLTANLKVGEIVSTKGFKQISIGGATYEIIEGTSSYIANGMGVIKLANGKKAKIKIINDKVTVEQFGAIPGDDIDDARSIQAALNSGSKNVEFQQGNYKCTTNIIMSTPNVNVIGNSCTLYTDNDYTSNNYYFLTVKASDTTINAITISAMETEVKGYNTQLGVLNCSNVSILNSSFIVPDKDLFIDGFIDNKYVRKSYSNVDLYTDWNNITIDHCTFTLRHRGPIGGCIWIRDYNNLGCDGLNFTNNTCTKSCNDEILAVFRGRIKNVNIDQNTFKMEEEYILNERDSYAPSNAAFTLSSPYSVYLENNEENNINFTRNTVNVETTKKLFNFGNVNGVLIDGNTINYNRIVTEKYPSNSQYPTLMFNSYPSYKINGIDTKCISNKITISNNIINDITDDKEYTLSNVLFGDYTMYNNTLNFKDIGLLSDENCKWDSNRIIVESIKEGLIKNATYFCNNDVLINGTFDRLFYYSNYDLAKGAIINNNKFTFTSLIWNQNPKILFNLG